MKNFILNNFILVVFFSLLIPIYYTFDTNFPLQNNFFPWDSHYYAKLASSFKFNESLPLVSDPWGYRILFPFLFGKLSLHSGLELVQSALIVNIVSFYLSILVYFKLCESYNVNKIFSFLIIFIYLLYWNGQLRHAIFLGGYSFCFDTFCITIYLYTIYKVLLENDKFLSVFAYLIGVLFIFQRPIVILFLPILILIFFIILERHKLSQNILSNKNKSFLIKLILLSSITFIVSKFVLNVSNSGYSVFHMIFTSIQFNLNLSDLLYIFYFSLGPVFLYFVNLVLLKKKILVQIFNKKIYSNISKRELLNINIILISLFFTLIGGADSDRFLLWFIFFILLPFTVYSEKIFKNYKFGSFIFILIALLWTRFYVPSMPPVSFSQTFEANNHVQTNYNPQLYFGPKILKKYQNETQTILIDDNKYKNVYLINNQKIAHEATFPVNQYCLTCKWFYRNSQVHPYKLRLSDLPVPIGYLHNQRNALIDHPKNGHRMIRFIYVLQWIILQIIVFYMFWKRFKKI